MAERWRTIPRHPRYQASTLGRVRLIKTRGVRKPVANCRSGYLQLAFFEARSGSRRRCVLRPVHQLVLEAFVGPRPEGKEARHLDGDRTNNKLLNLQWADHLENIHDKARHGTQPRGAASYQAKLTPREVRAIRRSTETQVVLAARYKMAQGTINRVRLGLTYKEVR